MRQRQVRFTEHDDARIEARADAAGVSVPKWMREVIKREINGIEPATVLREEFAREIAQIREENERFHDEMLQAFVALRDSLRQCQDALLDGFKEAIEEKYGGQSGLLNKSRPSEGRV